MFRWCSITKTAKVYYLYKRSSFFQLQGRIWEEGDFITSPEISQMFGECLGIWILHEWNKMGSPLPLQVCSFLKSHFHFTYTVGIRIPDIQITELFELQIFIVRYSNGEKSGIQTTI